MLQFRIYSMFLLLAIFAGSICSQTDPGTANLTHQWTFDNGTAADNVGTLNGVLSGGATIVNKALKLSASGQFLSFPGSSVALNTYTAFSQEIWFTSAAGANTGYTMLSYFGNTSGGLGYNYVSLSAARGDNVSRTCISNGTYSAEKGVNGTEYDDGKLHHMVSVVRADSVIFYIDGNLAGKAVSGVALSTIGTSLAYLGKGGYTSDPTWLGSISKFSIYNKSLTASEVKFLFNQGAESSPMLTASVTSLSFDEYIKSQTIYISALNLSGSISVSAPSGISLSTGSLAANASNASLTVSYDGVSTVNDTVVLTSGSTVLKIPVKSYSNSCFSKYYPALANLISDPYMSLLSNFSGWGNRSINTDPAYVYCGASSGKVSGTNAGSLDVSLTGKLQASTDYRVRAKVLALGGNFQIGLSGIGTSEVIKTITASNVWQTVDFVVTTGATIGTSPQMYFNNYGLTGTSGYIDNWEMYAVPKIYSTPATLSFESPGTKLLAIRTVNITEPIEISASEGFSTSVSSLPASTSATTFYVSYAGNVNTSGYVFFTSGTVKDSVKVTGTITPTIVSSVKTLLVDEINRTTTFTVKAYNLNTDISFITPKGISVSPSVLPANVNGSTVTVSYDGIENSSGTITLNSGSAVSNISITAHRNDECFTPLYSNLTNLISDPTCNTIISEGWGTRSINTDAAYVYCGARSAKVTGSGSIERGLTGVLKPNTTYRVKAHVYKHGSRPGQNMGNVTYTLAIDSVALPTPYRLIKEAMDSACMYFSKYTPFSYDIYVYYNSGIPTAQASYHGSIGFGSNTRYMWVGTAMHEMCHWFGSGTTSAWQSKMVGGVWTGAATNALMGSGVIKGDSQHFWPHGINQKEEITGLGTIAAQQAGLINTAKVAKTMIVDDAGLPTNNTSVGIGVYGWDATKDDIYYEVPTTNTWHEVDFTFTTGANLKATQKVYFSSGTGYIDNWEMYELSPVAGEVSNIINKVALSVANQRVVADFELNMPTDVNVFVYDIQGRVVQKITRTNAIGKCNVISNELVSSGIYIVKIQSDKFVEIRKVKI